MVTVGSSKVIIGKIHSDILQFTQASYVDHLFDSTGDSFARLPYYIIGMRPSSGKSVVVRDIMGAIPLEPRMYSPLTLRPGLTIYGAERISAQNIIIADHRTVHKWRYLLAGYMCRVIDTHQQLNILIRSGDYTEYKYLIIMAPALITSQMCIISEKYNKFVDTIFAYCVIDIDDYINFPLLLAQIYFVITDNIRYINNNAKITTATTAVTAVTVSSASSVGDARRQDLIYTFGNCVLEHLNAIGDNRGSNRGTVAGVYDVTNNQSPGAVVKNLYINLYGNTIKYTGEIDSVDSIRHRIRFSNTPSNMKIINRYAGAAFIDRIYSDINLELLNHLHISIIKNHILSGRMVGYSKLDTLLDIADIHYCSICSISKPRAYFLICCFNTICADCFYELMARETYICPYCRYLIVDSAILLNIYALEHIPTVASINLLYMLLIKTELLGSQNIKETLDSYINVKQLDTGTSANLYKDISRPISTYCSNIALPPDTRLENHRVSAPVSLDKHILQSELRRYERLNEAALGVPAIVSAISGNSAGSDIYGSGTVLVIHSNFDKVKFLLKYIGIKWADFSKIYRGGNSNLGKFRDFLSGRIGLLVINVDEIIAEYPNSSKINIYDTFSKHGSTAEFNALLAKLPDAISRILNYNLIYVDAKARWRYYDQVMRMLIRRGEVGRVVEVISVSIVY